MTGRQTEWSTTWQRTGSILDERKSSLFSGGMIHEASTSDCGFVGSGPTGIPPMNEGMSSLELFFVFLTGAAAL